MTLRWNPRGTAHGKVVLIHDVLSMAESWWRVGPALAARGWVTVAPDLAGHGGMPELVRPLDMSALVQGVVSRMPGQVDVLVGHGLGAIVALTLAGRYAGACRAIVLEDPPGTNVFESSGLLAAAGASSALVRSDRERLIRREQEAHEIWTREDVEYAVDAVAAADVPAILAGLRCRLGWDIRRLLAYAQVPVLVMAAPDDRAGSTPSDLSALSTADRKAIQARIPAQHFQVLPGGHYLHRDTPKQWVSTFIEFAESVLPDSHDPDQPEPRTPLIANRG
jgi:pimeloyl-ACP methyl ester carboxylesterase